MRKMMMTALAGAAAVWVMLGVLGAGAACNKIDNGGRLTELWMLIAEGVLLPESEYTTATWTPFAAALKEAERVAGSSKPSAEALDAATSGLRGAMGALVSREFLRGELTTAIAVSDATAAAGSAGYTAASWAAFEQALAAAKRIVADQSARPDELQKTLDELSAAFYSLARV